MAMAVKVVTLPIAVLQAMVAWAVMEVRVELLRLLTLDPFNLIHQFPFLHKVKVAQVALAAILQAVFLMVVVVEAVAMVKVPTRFLLVVREI